MFYPGKAVFRAGIASASGWDNSNCGYASVAFGDGSFASGTHSFAMNSATATGTHSYSTWLWIYFFWQLFSLPELIWRINQGHIVFQVEIIMQQMGPDHSLPAVIRSHGLLVRLLLATPLLRRLHSQLQLVFLMIRFLLSTESSVADYTPLFIIGNGNGPANRSNAFVVRKDGYVGIGTNAPSQLLTVAGNICADRLYCLLFRTSGIKRTYYQ